MSGGISVDWSLDGKVAIVTGAAPGGIGETYARALAAAGAAVVCADIRADGASKVADGLEADGHRAIGVQVDITDPDSVRTMTRTTASTFGGVDVLVNNAALMATVHPGPVLECDYDHWKHVMDVNLNGAYLCCRSAVPYMRERGGGRIVNQTSGGAYPPSTLYGITKLALVGLTTTLARELGPSQITVNAIAPGLVESDAGKGLVPKGSPFREMIEQTVAMQAFAAPEELAGTLLLLTTPAGNWITGQVIHADGGWILRP